MVTQQRTSPVPRYDPAGQYEVRSRDVEYRRDGADSWLARIYEPQGMGPFPALLEIHGGAWNNNDRTQNASIDEAPDVDAGLAYVMMGWAVLDPHARYLYARERGRQNLVASSERYFVDEAGMREANPQLILERGEPVELPPALLLHGADDDILAPRTAERFVEAYGRAGGV